MSYVDLYKHHFDLFVKGYLIHLAIIGTSAGFIFRQESDYGTKLGLAIFAAVIAICGACTWGVSFLWAIAFCNQVQELAHKLNVAPLPMFGLKAVLLFSVLGSTLFAMGAIIAAITIAWF